MEESTSLNIIFLPDEKTRNRAIELSQKVASKLPIEFVLGQGTIPHITIYQAPFPTKNIGKIKETIKEIVSEIRPFEIGMKTFLTNFGVPGFVSWNSIKTHELEEAHLKTINRINAFREELIPDGLKSYSGSEEFKQDIEDYGSLLVNKHYSPHITITRLKNPNDAGKALEILGTEDHSFFTAGSIALGYLGDHGTVTGIIEEFPLAS